MAAPPRTGNARPREREPDLDVSERDEDRAAGKYAAIRYRAGNDGRDETSRGRSGSGDASTRDHRQLGAGQRGATLVEPDDPRQGPHIERRSCYFERVANPVRSHKSG